MKATFLGWVSGIFLVILLSSVLDSMGIENFQFYIGAGMGIGVGWAQGRVLQTAGKLSAVWWWTTTLGLGVPFLLFDFYAHYFSVSLGDRYLPVSLFTGSLAAGLLHYGYLKKYYAAAVWWLPASVLGWLLAGGTVYLVTYTRHIASSNALLFVLNLSLILSGGWVLGKVTGFVLVQKVTNAAKQA
jgi:hypothetical protein